MKKLNNTSRLAVTLVALIMMPSLTNACGMSAIGAAALGEALMIAAFIFLIGYLPYLFLSIKLARQASRPEGTTKGTRIWASIFAGINTLVFLSAVAFIASAGIVLFIGDLLLWGIPFYFYIKGIRSQPSMKNSDLLDA